MEGRAARSYRGPRVESATHGIRRREAADADHGLGSHRFYESNEFLLIPFSRESRRLRVVGPVTHVHVPQIGQFASISTTSRPRCRR